MAIKRKAVETKRVEMFSPDWDDIEAMIRYHEMEGWQFEKFCTEMGAQRKPPPVRRGFWVRGGLAATVVFALFVTKEIFAEHDEEDDDCANIKPEHASAKHDHKQDYDPQYIAT